MLLAPADQAVAPADALLAGGGSERTDRKPAAYDRVRGQVGGAPQHLGIADEQPLPQSRPVAFDVHSITDPGFTLHHQLDGTCRIAVLKPRVGAQSFDAQPVAARKRLPAQRLEQFESRIGFSVV